MVSQERQVVVTSRAGEATWQLKVLDMFKAVVAYLQKNSFAVPVALQLSIKY